MIWARICQNYFHIFSEHFITYPHPLDQKKVISHCQDWIFAKSQTKASLIYENLTYAMFIDLVITCSSSLVRFFDDWLLLALRHHIMFWNCIMIWFVVSINDFLGLTYWQVFSAEVDQGSISEKQKTVACWNYKYLSTNIFLISSLAICKTYLSFYLYRAKHGLLGMRA